jgi:hypothetical protein
MSNRPIYAVDVRSSAERTFPLSCFMRTHYPDKGQLLAIADLTIGKGHQAHCEVVAVCFLAKILGDSTGIDLTI